MTDLATPAAVADGSDTPGDPSPGPRSEGRPGGPEPPGPLVRPAAAGESAPTSALDEVLTAQELQAAARDAYRASVGSGTRLTGADLGRRFGRTARWGRMQISAARAETEAATGASSNGDGPHPTGNTHRISSAPPLAGKARLDRPHQGIQTRGERQSHTGNGRLGGSPDAISPPRPPAEPSSDRPGEAWLDSTITLAVALVAAAASYGHMLDVALVAGEPLWIARAFPITVDGLALAALRRGPDGRRWLALAAAVSIAANVLAQYPHHAEAAGPLVSAWPPLALYGTHRLLHSRRGIDGP